MGSRESNPWGGASASAAYHTTLRPNAADIRTHLDRRSSHAPLALGPLSTPYGSGSLAGTAHPGGPLAGTPYGSGALIGGVYPGVGSTPGFGLRGSDLHGGGLSSVLHSRALLAEAQVLGSELHPYDRNSHHLLAGLQPYGRSSSGSYCERSNAFHAGASSVLEEKSLSYGGRPDALRAGIADLLPYSAASLMRTGAGKLVSLHGEADMLEVCRGPAKASSGPQVLSHACAAQTALQRTMALQAYGHPAEKARVLMEEQNVAEVKVLKRKAEQKAFTASKRVGAAVERKRKPTLEALIKETWELHSLFRAGLAAAADKRKTSNGVAEEARPAMNHTYKTGGQWGDPPSPGKAQPASAWDDLSKGEPEPTSSFEDLDVPSSSWEELEEMPPKTMVKDASLTPEVRQEHYASNLHRIACESVAEFMGNSSDGDESDDEFCTDSDEEAPDPFVRSSHNVKSREEQAYDFFLQHFEENQELQKLYKEQCNTGKFECLVCSSITGKPIKRFNGLVSVVMHASKIQKTKKKQEHRGYGRAVCSILGWDFCRMPAVLNQTSLRPRGCLPPDEEERNNTSDTEPEGSVHLNVEDEDDPEALEESEGDEAKEEGPGLEYEERNHESSEDSDASEASKESDAGEDNEVKD